MGFVIVLLTAACGKKGPPLAPFVPIPAAVEQIAAERVGQEVYVSLTVPASNIDEFAPANLERIDVWAYTGRTAPPRGRWVEFGTLVASIPVAPPADPDAPAAPAAGPDTPSREAAQGSVVTIVDTLTPDELEQGRLPEPRTSEPRTPNLEPNPNQNPEPGTRNQEPAALRRHYTALPWSRRGRPGPPGAVAEFALLPVPDAPPTVAATYSEAAVRLEWEPAGGLIGFLFERPLPDEEPPVEFEEPPAAVAPAPPAGPVQYNVYREIVPDVLAPPPAPASPWQVAVPTPINPAPVSALEFSEPVVFGDQRCYRVRAVRAAGAEMRIGDASPPACLTPIDTFPPAAPQSLGTVASAGAINLIWEPNVEPDLAGYLVLRGEATGDTLQPLTAAPVPDARYRDEAVTPGVRYVYVVMAVDNRFPVPNVSEASAPVEETAR